MSCLRVLRGGGRGRGSDASQLGGRRGAEGEERRGEESVRLYELSRRVDLLLVVTELCLFELLRSEGELLLKLLECELRLWRLLRAGVGHCSRVGRGKSDGERWGSRRTRR